ncbi:hypothetical protein OPKNFCMD_0144 [Methylobacterium crusticola]|uniref:Uncharacterized protein n=1 Tax=Methylobacterium crusticola TaxID=1697972 RepID=A0ABQ4QRW2_9HYPH|nr:DUF6481 family protein [Methylobacterium crusticola]GJD47436.1 hypothetical protein OPKNFCMD_0144 [Methylobacterium crusticola]
MSGFKEARLADRLQSAGEARKAMLARFQARPALDDPAVAARNAERQTLSEARTARLAERAEARAAEAARLTAEQAERREREAADQARAAADAVDRTSKLQADQKAARDARYAARKARRHG